VVASHCLIAGTASTVAMLEGPRGGAWLDRLGLPSLRVGEDGEISGSLALRESGGYAQNSSTA
jgi:thiamine biosynthesis lipoprotein